MEKDLLDFKHILDVNYAIRDAFIYVRTINRSKFLLDTLHWEVEQLVNEDLFEESTPWNKGYTETIDPATGKTTDVRPSNQNDPVSDNPSPEETRYIKRDRNLREYVPKIYTNYIEHQGNINYQLIDSRVCSLALSWWTMFLSTKDGIRMIYYPYTSQLKDNINLSEHPSRTAWFKDELLSSYYADLGLNYAENFPETLSLEHQYDINFNLMVDMLNTKGLNFVLWLYNYIKVNNGLCPYNFYEEFYESIYDVPQYRGGSTINLENTNVFGKSAPSNSENQIDSATGLSQTELRREYNSCGIIINTLDNQDEINFSNSNLKRRLSRNLDFDFFENINLPQNMVIKKKENIQSNSRIEKEAIIMSNSFTNSRMKSPYPDTGRLNVDRMRREGLLGGTIEWFYDGNVKRETKKVDEKILRR